MTDSDVHDDGEDASGDDEGRIRVRKGDGDCGLCCGRSTKGAGAAIFVNRWSINRFLHRTALGRLGDNLITTWEPLAVLGRWVGALVVCERECDCVLRLW